MGAGPPMGRISDPHPHPSGLKSAGAIVIPISGLKIVFLYLTNEVNFGKDIL